MNHLDDYEKMLKRTKDMGGPKDYQTYLTLKGVIGGVLLTLSALTLTYFSKKTDESKNE